MFHIICVYACLSMCRPCCDACICAPWLHVGQVWGRGHSLPILEFHQHTPHADLFWACGLEQQGSNCCMERVSVWSCNRLEEPPTRPVSPEMPRRGTKHASHKQQYQHNIASVRCSIHQLQRGIWNCSSRDERNLWKCCLSHSFTYTFQVQSAMSCMIIMKICWHVTYTFPYLQIICAIDALKADKTTDDAGIIISTGACVYKTRRAPAKPIYLCTLSATELYQQQDSMTSQMAKSFQMTALKIRILLFIDQ